VKALSFRQFEKISRADQEKSWNFSKIFPAAAAAHCTAAIRVVIFVTG
jgi:hypothetical protein